METYFYNTVLTNGYLLEKGHICYIFVNLIGNLETCLQKRVSTGKRINTLKQGGGALDVLNCSQN